MGGITGTNYPFSQIFTGQIFPDGTRTVNGTCSRCGRQGDVAHLHVKFPFTGIGASNSLVCAECLADFAAGAKFLAAQVYVACADGNFHLVGFGVPPSAGSAALGRRW